MTEQTRGRYSYVCDGKPIPVEESFTLERQERGLVVVSQRSAPGTRMGVEVVYGIDGRTTASLTWTSELEGTSPASTVVYTVDGEGAVVFTDAEAVSHAVDTPADTSFFPLMRVYSGRSLSKVVEGAASGANVLTPDIRDPRALDRWLRPLVDRRRAASVVAGSLDVDGVARDCRIVEYLGGSYDQPATVWLDEGGLLLRYTWDQPGVGDWDVRLTDVEGPWPAPVSW